MTTDTITPLSQVETDAFCDCGYNLHSQPVWRDERLDILVCRCPECGRHAAAGRFTGIHSAWLHRLSLGLVISWVLALIAVFLFLTIMLGVWPAIHADETIRFQPVPNTTANQTLYVYDVQDMSIRHWRSWVLFVSMMGGLATLNGLIIGVITATCLWHLRRLAFLTLLLPVAAVGFLYAVWTSSEQEMTAAAYRWIGTRFTAYIALEWGAIVVGLVFGRTVARFVLRLLLPDRALQHLAFLWQRDGKELRLATKA